LPNVTDAVVISPAVQEQLLVDACAHFRDQRRPSGSDRLPFFAAAALRHPGTLPLTQALSNPDLEQLVFQVMTGLGDLTVDALDDMLSSKSSVCRNETTSCGWFSRLVSLRSSATLTCF
jgi:hypothetical protein